MMRSTAHLSIESMCRLGQVSQAGFYRHWKEHEPRAEQAELRARMQQIVLANRRNYGYRRVTRELRNQGFAANHKCPWGAAPGTGADLGHRLRLAPASAKYGLAAET